MWYHVFTILNSNEGVMRERNNDWFLSSMISLIFGVIIIITVTVMG